MKKKKTKKDLEKEMLNLIEMKEKNQKRIKEEMMNSTRMSLRISGKHKFIDWQKDYPVYKFQTKREVL